MNRRTKLYLEIVFGCLVFFALSCLGQNTGTITGTITDTPDAVPWANGSWAATFYNPRGGNATFINSGQPVSPLQYPTSSLTPAGSFSISGFPLNNAIAPAGTQWIFTFCPNAVTGCVTLPPISINQAGDITAQVSNYIKSPRFPASGANQFGYADTEIEPLPVPGGFYYNVTTPCQRVWSGTAWSCQGTGASGGGGVGIPLTCSTTTDSAPGINSIIAANPRTSYLLPPGTCYIASSINLTSGRLIGWGANETATGTNPYGSTLNVAYGVKAIIAGSGTYVGNISIVGSEPSNIGNSSTLVFPAASCIDQQQYKLPITSFSVVGGVLTLSFGDIFAFYKAGGIMTVQGIAAPNTNLNGQYYLATVNNHYVAGVTIAVPGAPPVASVSPQITTTATGAAGQNIITVASATGLAVGQYVAGGVAVPTNTFVTAISGNSVTLSNNLLFSGLSGTNVTFQPVLRASSTGSCSDGVDIVGNSATVENVSATNFGLAGIEDNGETPNVADSPYISNVQLFNNRFAGFFAHGEDANAGTYNAGLYYFNGFAGIVDLGFLGSAYIQPTVSYNYGGNTGMSSWPGEGPATSGCRLTRAAPDANGLSSVTVTSCTTLANLSIGSQIVTHGWLDASFNAPTSPASSSGYVTSLSPFTYVQPGYNLGSGTTTGGTIAIASAVQAYTGFGLNGGSYVIGLNNTAGFWTLVKPYMEAGQNQTNTTGCSFQGTFATQLINPDIDSSDCLDPNFNSMMMRSSQVNGTVLTANAVSLGNPAYSFAIPVGLPSASNSYLSCPSLNAEGQWQCVWVAGGTGGGGGGGGVNSGTAGQLATYLTSGASVSGDSNLYHSGSTLVVGDTSGISAAQGTFGTATTMPQDVTAYYLNATTTGTVANFLAKIVSGNAVETTTSDTAVPRLFAALATCSGGAAGTTGHACLVNSGIATVTFDGSGATAGDLVGASTTVAGAAKDLGTTHTGITCLGMVLTSVLANQTGQVHIGACGP